MCQACAEAEAAVPATLSAAADTQHQPAAQSGHAPPGLQAFGGQTMWRQPAFWGVCGITAIVCILLLAAYLILRPTWEDQHRSQLLAIRQEADAMLADGRAKDAYYKLKELHDLVGDRELSDSTLKYELRLAEKQMAKARQQASAEIAREEAAERARVEAAARAEEERKRQEQLAAAQRAEQERRQEAERRQERERAEREAAERARLALAREAVKKSPELVRLRAEARRVYTNSRTRMIGEDSAYRAMSTQSKAARDLLAIYVKIQGVLNDVRVEQEVDRAIRLSDIRMMNEDSAIRAVYKYDQAFFELLGVWCKMLDKRYPGIHTRFEKRRELVDSLTSLDNSAPRAISRYSEASVEVLKQILSHTEAATAARDASSSAATGNAMDDSAWRNAMRNVEAIGNMLIALLETVDPVHAAEIKRHEAREMIGEDSALRAHRLHKEVIVRTLNELIAKD